MTSKITIHWGIVGRELKRRMGENGWTFREAERRIGIDHSTLVRIATGRRCTVEAYLTLCRGFLWDPMRPSFVKTDGAEA